MLDQLERSDIDELLQDGYEHCVSIFVPTGSVEGESSEARIRLKNIMAEAESRLSERGLRSAEIRSILQPVNERLEISEFWMDTDRGLAIFLGPSFSRLYRSSRAFVPFVCVGRHFHFTPLLPLLQAKGEFLLLALNLDRVRLYQGDAHGLEEVSPEYMPESLTEALRFDDPERQLQFHTSTDSAGPEQRSAAFHGHGVGDKEQKKVRILRYFQKVSSAVKSFLGEDPLPLVLAGVEYLHPIYREASDYPHLLEPTVPGRPEDYGSDEFHRSAWELVEPHYQRDIQRVRQSYMDRIESEGASSDLREILPAAYQSRVAAILIEQGRKIWGRYDPDQDKLVLLPEQEAGVEDLLNLAARYTLRYGGRAIVLPEEEMPQGAAAAAVFRF